MFTYLSICLTYCFAYEKSVSDAKMYIKSNTEILHQEYMEVKM